MARDRHGRGVRGGEDAFAAMPKGLPSEAVDAAKRDRYEKIAAAFLAEYDVVDVPVRFDVVSIVTVAPDRAMIRHHIDAFGVE